MKSHWILAVVALVASATASRAQTVIVDTQKDGKQRITNLTPAEPPRVVNNQSFDPAPAEAKGAVLNAKNWLCGKQFTDDNGKTWRLHVGTPETANGAQVSGWMIRGRDGSLVFVSANGGVFVPSPIPIGPVPLKNLQEQFRSKQ
jgi:hypothetical protein